MPPNRLGSAAQNLLLASELLGIAEELDGTAVPFIILKGLPLTQRLFGAFDRRRILDNDILVHPSDVPRARQALRDLGYENLYPVPGSGTAHARDNQESLVRGSAVAEIHWSAFKPLLANVPEKLQWERTQQVELMGRTLTVFDDTLTLLHLSYHFAQHSFSERRILEEIAAAWNAWGESIDRADLARLGRATGLEAFLDFSLTSAHELGMLTIAPPPIGSRRAARLRRLLPAHRLFERRPGSGYWRTTLIFVLGDPSAYPRYVFRSAFPPLESLAAIYGRPVSKSLYLRYATRPFRALRRIVTRTPANAPVPNQRKT